MDLNAFVCDLRQPASCKLIPTIVDLDSDVDGAECDESELRSCLHFLIEEASKSGAACCRVSTQLVEADGCDFSSGQWLADGVYSVLTVGFAASAFTANAGIEHLPKPAEFDDHASAARLAHLVAGVGGLITVQTSGGTNVTWRLYFRSSGVAIPAFDFDETVTSKTILLVEDEDFVRSVTREVLELSGYRVLEARNATEGVDLFTKNMCDVDLVLTDVVMPGMNGTELVRKLLALAPALQVVFMSG